MRDASLAELGELSAHKPPMRGQKIFSQGKGLTAAHFLIPDIKLDFDHVDATCARGSPRSRQGY